MARTRSAVQRQQAEGPTTTPPSTPSRTRPARNRVAATIPLRTPSPAAAPRPWAPSTPFLSDDESPTRSGGLPLPLNIQKELAQDIERAGGIKLLSANEQSLSHLCNSREDIYGRRGHPLRQQIQKKVYRWKGLDQSNQYVDRVLNRLGVKSTENLKQAEKKNLPLDKADEDVSDSESSSDSSLSSTSSNNSTSSPPMPPKRVSRKKSAPLPSNNFPAAAVESQTRMSSQSQSQDKQAHSRNTHTAAPAGACKF
jgi:hypothetical protein